MKTLIHLQPFPVVLHPSKLLPHNNFPPKRNALLHVTTRHLVPSMLHFGRKTSQAVRSPQITIGLSSEILVLTNLLWFRHLDITCITSVK